MTKGKDALGARMKSYEHFQRTYLTNKTPVLVRVDGRSFHTLLRKARKPFDDSVIYTMREVMKELVKQTNAVFAYCQSDEISLVLWDGFRPESQAWFGNNLNKIVSVTASIASAVFNLYLPEDVDIVGEYAVFDSRAFNIPEEEVGNYFIWRQMDWRRNYVAMLARSVFSHKELLNKDTNQVKYMLLERDIHVDSLPNMFRFGSFIHHAHDKILELDFIQARNENAGFFDMPRAKE